MPPIARERERSVDYRSRTAKGVGRTRNPETAVTRPADPASSSAARTELTAWRRAVLAELAGPRGWWSVAGLAWVRDEPENWGSAPACRMALPARCPARVAELRRAKIAAETRECTFQPALNARSQRMTAARVEAAACSGLRACDRLYVEADRRRAKHEALAAQLPPEATFAPKVRYLRKRVALMDDWLISWVVKLLV